MKKITLVAAVAVSLAVSAGIATAAGQLKGAGSSFVFPLVSQWQAKYKGAQIVYSPIGSGAGINAISSRTVDFGASDAPLTKDQAAAGHGLVQMPWALSATSIPYHVPGVGYGLKLTGPILADIYLGKIKRWNDKRIGKLNPGVKLPSLGITPVFRSDASGTSYNFTDYLSSVSSGWQHKVGVGTQPAFPKGVGASKSSGVAAAVSRTDGAIGYVDVAYALKNHFQVAKIQNRAGKFALPGWRGIGAAASTVKRVPGNGAISIVNPPKSKPLAYPICTFTWVLVPKKTHRASDLRKFIKWAATSGQQYGKPLLFYPLPKVVVKYDLATVKKLRS